LDLWQSVHVLEQDAEQRYPDLLNRSLYPGTGQYHLNLIPVGSQKSDIVCVAAFQVALKHIGSTRKKARKVNLFNHELPNQDEYPAGTRILMFQPN
jgi:hypothetical protein